ncbi:MAG: biotin synthase [Oscillospiraceae bacterium]|nr:biotin synthase [Oscillospiraceae bacterium]
MNYVAKENVSTERKILLMRRDASLEITNDGEQRAFGNAASFTGLANPAGGTNSSANFAALTSPTGLIGSAGPAVPAGPIGSANVCGAADIVTTSSVPKVFLSNDCAFNCAYCGCRRSFEAKERYSTAPRELAEIAYAQIGKGCPGVFITSAVFKTPDYTQELIIEALRILRNEMRYSGYLHAKVMPGADPLLIRRTGLYANRLSVNIEVAKSEGYALIAKNKSKENILRPMGDISGLVRAAGEERKIFRHSQFTATSHTTQLMAGSLGEDDGTILRLSNALYKKYSLSRIYYTSYQYRYTAKGYEDLPLVNTPAWRMHRLYQADRLMQLYGYSVNDIVPDESEFLLDQNYDPKAAWALRNMQFFPVEVNAADREALLRVPGIGVTGAERILAARRQGRLSFDALKSLGISLKRSKHFITCGGKFSGSMSERVIRYSLSNGAANGQLTLAM